MKQLFRLGKRRCIKCNNVFNLNEKNFNRTKLKKQGGYEYKCLDCSKNVKKQLFKIGKRRCCGCRKIFELNENNFYKTKSKRQGGYRYECKKCGIIRRMNLGFKPYNSEKRKEYYKKQRETILLKRRKDRFLIFKRDNFTCQYCGRKVPDVILQIDHIHPKSKGGKNLLDNYATACRECNIGKSDMLL